ncbi:hypothetical protein CDAR_251221 [Caerostris darwini]|uniref:Uncharacterized protein n=1 Tax=Caerostris darwini TaxID=1538125 RepID=A0AAV4RAD9_9ARAC|nr:hypothetical protein CDAR_251221 [Caerostris darwini]
MLIPTLLRADNEQFRLSKKHTVLITYPELLTKRNLTRQRERRWEKKTMSFSEEKLSGQRIKKNNKNRMQQAVVNLREAQCGYGALSLCVFDGNYLNNFTPFFVVQRARENIFLVY